MAKTEGIRHRLLSILLLGVLVSGLTLLALIHLLRTTTHQRIERARDAVTEELDRLTKDPHSTTEPPAVAIIGMRGGVSSPSAPLPGLSRDFADAVHQALEQGAERHGRVTLDVSSDDSTLVVASEPISDGSSAWTAFAVRPLPQLRTWQWIVTLLALATAILVATTFYAIVTVQRGATALRTALSALATDLSAPIPRPNVRELASVAEGVERLAEGLAKAKREEERLERELAKQERLVALGRVAAGVAHEVRNPLASIKLRLDLAAAGAPLPEAVQKAIAHATSEINRLDRLVADLLIVAGRTTGPRQVFSLGALVKDRAEALSPWARERGVALLVRGETRIDANADSIARAVDNLLRNAIEASPAEKPVDVTIEVTGTDAVVAVSDHGTGVPSEHRRSLFEPFFTTKLEGTGLGLALSRAIARAHGGDASYVRQGEVTRFELRLPISADELDVPSSDSHDGAAPNAPAGLSA